MMTCEEMTANVLRIGEKRLAAHRKRRKTAGALCGTALLLAAFLGAGRALLRQPALPADTVTKEGPQAAVQASVPAVSAPATTAAEEETAAVTVEEPATTGGNVPLPTTAAPPPTTAAPPPTTAAPPVPDDPGGDVIFATTAAPESPTVTAPPEEGTLPLVNGVTGYSKEGIRRLAAENKLGWIKIGGRLYVHDAWAGTHENGEPKSPGDRLGAVAEFESNFGLFNITGEVYTLRGRADAAEIMVITARGDRIFLIDASD